MCHLQLDKLVKMKQMYELNKVKGCQSDSL